MRHPFKEFHEDAEIGNLMWRIRRRNERLADSQDGVESLEIERQLASDKKELVKLQIAYEGSTPTSQ